MSHAADFYTICKQSHRISSAWRQVSQNGNRWSNMNQDSSSSWQGTLCSQNIKAAPWVQIHCPFHTQFNCTARWSQLRLSLIQTNLEMWGHAASSRWGVRLLIPLTAVLINSQKTMMSTWGHKKSAEIWPKDEMLQVSMLPSPLRGWRGLGDIETWRDCSKVTKSRSGWSMAHVQLWYGQMKKYVWLRERGTIKMIVFIPWTSKIFLSARGLSFITIIVPMWCSGLASRMMAGKPFLWSYQRGWRLKRRPTWRLWGWRSSPGFKH